MKSFFRATVLGLVSILCCGCGAGQQGNEGSSAQLWQYTDTAMGTVIHQSIYCAEEETAQAFFGEAMELLNQLERERLSWRLDTSEIYQVNSCAGKEEGCPLSAEMARLLGECMELTEKSNGAFDISLGSLVRLWNIDNWAAGRQEGDFTLPSAEAIGQALDVCGGLTLVRGEQPYAVLPKGVQLDLGAVGKGLALTELQQLLDQYPQVTGAVISVGGSVLTYGGKPDGSGWNVGIVSPFNQASNIGIVSLEGQWCVSTSGDYERYAEVGGVRYHHILDPSTGYPAESGVCSVTIVSKDGMLSDGLSTACFILGEVKGMELAGQYGAEVLFVLEDGELVMSEGMEKIFRK